jgi:hypothetical protein
MLIRQAYKTLPTWGKVAVFIAILVLLFFVLRWGKKYLEKALSQKNAKDEVKSAADRLIELSNEGILPTISRVDTEGMANAIQQAADGCDPYGQGAQVIMQRIYALQNEADWRQLYEVFGVRTWDECGVWAGDVTGSLTTLMISELDSSQLAEARRHVGQFNVTF